MLIVSFDKLMDRVEETFELRKEISDSYFHTKTREGTRAHVELARAKNQGIFLSTISVQNCG